MRYYRFNIPMTSHKRKLDRQEQVVTTVAIIAVVLVSVLVHLVVDLYKYRQMRQTFLIMMQMLFRSM